MKMKPATEVVLEFTWESPNCITVYMETPSQLFETMFDRVVIARVYTERPYLVFWRGNKMVSRRYRKSLSIIDAVFRKVPQVRRLKPDYRYTVWETPSAKTTRVRFPVPSIPVSTGRP